MPDIHYTDAILTLLFAGQLYFGRWVVMRFMAIDRRMVKSERRMKKYFKKANLQGAQIVAEALRTVRLMNGSKSETPQSAH